MINYSFNIIGHLILSIQVGCTVNGGLGDGNEQGTCDSNFFCHKDGTCKAALIGSYYKLDIVKHLIQHNILAWFILLKIFLIKIFSGYRCKDLKHLDDSDSTHYDYYCFSSKIDGQQFCIGQYGVRKYHKCTDLHQGINFDFDKSGTAPMRFNRQGETKCLNYHPDYLQNLARALGYKNYVIGYKKAGNLCRLAYIDDNGNFQIMAGNSSIEKIYDVSFWNWISYK